MTTCISLNKLAAIVLPPVLCCACAHMYTNDQIFNDADAYAADAFAPGKLTRASKQIASQLHKPAAAFNSITVSVKASVEGTGNFRSNPRGEITFTNLGDGQIREVQKFTNNDIPTRFGFSIGYLSMFPLRTQVIPYGMTKTRDITEVKSISSFPLDAWKPVEGQVYEYAGSIGSEANIGGFSPFRFTCKAGASYPASAFSPKLSGLATDFACERRINNVITTKTVQALWHDYGVAVTTSNQTSNAKETVSIVDVRID
jgi:hypothetical protein